MRAEAEKSYLDLLTKEQRAKYEELLGEKIDTAKVIKEIADFEI